MERLVVVWRDWWLYGETCGCMERLVVVWRDL